MSDSPGLVDFAIGLFSTCPTGMWSFLGSSNYRRTVINPTNQKLSWTSSQLAWKASCKTDFLCTLYLLLDIISAWFTTCTYRVCTLFCKKNSKTFQGLSRTHFPFSKAIQSKKEPWLYVFFSSSTTWAILSWRSFLCFLLSFTVLLKLFDLV